MPQSAETVDGYLAALPEDQRAALENVRSTIKAAAPDAVESISYGVPAYKYKGRPLIYFGAAKNHVAIYGGINPEAHKKELQGYDTSKGTVRFTPDKPLPDRIVRKLIEARIADIEVGATAYGKKQRKAGST